MLLVESGDRPPPVCPKIRTTNPFCGQPKKLCPVVRQTTRPIILISCSERGVKDLPPTPVSEKKCMHVYPLESLHIYIQSENVSFSLLVVLIDNTLQMKPVDNDRGL